MQRYRCGNVRSFHELCACWRLVQQEYRELGYAVDRPSGMRYSITDFHPDSTVFSAIELDRLVGTFSAVLGDRLPLPSMNAFPEEVNALLNQGKRIIEATKFAADKDTVDSHKSVHLMIAQLFGWAHRMQADVVIMTINPRHEQFWKQKFGFQEIARTGSCAHVSSAPGILLQAPVNRSARRVILAGESTFHSDILTEQRKKILCSADLKVLRDAFSQGLLERETHLKSLLSYHSILDSEKETELVLVNPEQLSFGGKLSDLLNDLRDISTIRAEQRGVHFELSSRFPSSELALPHVDISIFIMTALLNGFIDTSIPGVKLYGTLQTLRNHKAGSLFLLLQEHRARYSGQVETAMVAEDSLLACRYLSRLGGHIAVDRLGKIRYLALLLPLVPFLKKASCASGSYQSHQVEPQSFLEKPMMGIESTSDKSVRSWFENNSRHS